MKSSSALLTCAVLLALLVDAIVSSSVPYPSPYGGDTACNPTGVGDFVPVRREFYDGGRIFDISHRYRTDMPSWDSDDGLGQFLWLPKSMKNGSAGQQLRDEAPDSHRHARRCTWPLNMLGGKMRALLVLLVCSKVLAIATNDAYPSGYGDDRACCGTGDKLVPLRMEVYGNGRIFDITHRITPETCGGSGVGQIISLSLSMKNGSDYNFSIMKLPVHAGTHVDAPGHVFERYFDAGFDVDTLDLDVLNGLELGRFTCILS
ncbi:cyclase family protein [Actinidia rufa]|uniref:Cyclase family protein n=1 Tax=Actinidia rufa TaxID=165716 RepID=A0A7J0ET96_9ERIC|nr:cyclase family protein [Actinidia rufa]